MLGRDACGDALISEVVRRATRQAERRRARRRLADMMHYPSVGKGRALGANHVPGPSQPVAQVQGRQCNNTRQKARPFPLPKVASTNCN